MAVLALILTFAWIGIVAGVRGYLHLRRTGESGIDAHDPRWSPQWWSRRISTLGVLFAIAAPLAELTGMPSIAALAIPTVHALGVALVLLGIVLTVMAQVAMGASWRGDVKADAQTDLVTTGPFRFVRNPIFTGTAMTAVGLALLVPNVLALAMLLAFLAALQIQVRLVEEPYLLRVHGDAYWRYAARTGRFLPRIGRLT